MFDTAPLHDTTAPPIPVTLHDLVRDALRSRIVAGTYQPHDRLPSESALVQQFGVSRITVRHALGDLERERLIVKIPGKGSFVAASPAQHGLERLQGFAEAMAPGGHAIVNRVVRVATVVATPQVAQRLHLPVPSAVTEIHRVRLMDGQPVSLDVTWLPLAIGVRVIAADLVQRDIFRILEDDLGLALGHADLAIGAVLADAPLAEALDTVPGVPMLRVDRLTHDRAGRPLDYEHLHYRADRFQYRARIERQPGLPTR